MYDGRGFALPGSPGGAPEYLARHDFVHVLADYGTNLKGEEVLGITTVADIAELPDGELDLVFVCTPAASNPDLLRACAAKGIRAAFLTSAGYGQAGDGGRVAGDGLGARGGTR